MKVEVERISDRLHLTFQLPGNLNLVWPPNADQPERQSNLWETTCFECFIGLANSPLYLETNLSPAGHWQTYEFSDYRQGQKLTDRVTIGSPASNRLLVQCYIDVSHPHFVTQDWKISPCCVLAVENGDLYYLSSAHMAAQPDFHQLTARVHTVQYIKSKT